MLFQIDYRSSRLAALLSELFCPLSLPLVLALISLQQLQYDSLIHLLPLLVVIAINSISLAIGIGVIFFLLSKARKGMSQRALTLILNKARKSFIQKAKQSFTLPVSLVVNPSKNSFILIYLPALFPALNSRQILASSAVDNLKPFAHIGLHSKRSVRVCCRNWQLIG